MRITLVGSRHFGVTTFNMLRQHGVDIVRVVVHDGEDRLAAAARAAGIEVVVQADPKRVAASEIAPDTDLIVTAHSHARVTREALAAAKLGGIGYHPSLLPRHRGIAAVEWTIKEGDPIAGGTVYHLADRMDAGAIAAQEWVFVKKGETARELWERALAPLGQKLLADVIYYAKTHNSLPAKPAGRGIRHQGAEPCPMPNTEPYLNTSDASTSCAESVAKSQIFRSPAGTGFTLMCLSSQELSPCCGAPKFGHIVTR